MAKLTVTGNVALMGIVIRCRLVQLRGGGGRVSIHCGRRGLMAVDGGARWFAARLTYYTVRLFGNVRKVFRERI